MQFRTEITLPESDWQITHHSRLMLAGSCFAELIGDKLSQAKFATTVNPFGVIYHPVPLLRPLAWAVEDAVEPMVKRIFRDSDGLWRNFDSAGAIQSNNLESVKAELRETMHATKENLRTANYLILTFGSASGYQLADDGNIVANCHKEPASRFTKRIWMPEELISATLPLLQKLLDFNSELRVILTVSPVRHLREGLENDRLSKSVLRVLCESLRNDRVRYFPAYELFTDDLRDYRFTTEDLSHPNEMAVNYIWEKFEGVYLPASTRALVIEWEKLRKDLEHRPLFPGLDAHKRFLRGALNRLETLGRELNLEEEIKHVKSLINNQL